MSKFMERFGINLRAVYCPECGRKMAFFRVPSSLRQWMWGGYRCRDCSCEMDRWGRPMETIDSGKKASV